MAPAAATTFMTPSMRTLVEALNSNRLRNAGTVNLTPANRQPQSTALHRYPRSWQSRKISKQQDLSSAALSDAATATTPMAPPQCSTSFRLLQRCNDPPTGRQRRPQMR